MSEIDWSKAIDEMLKTIHLEEVVDQGKAEGVAISFWVTPEQKEKYAEIQRMTKKEFGRMLKQLVLMAIDRVAIKDKAA